MGPVEPVAVERLAIADAVEETGRRLGLGENHLKIAPDPFPGGFRSQPQQRQRQHAAANPADLPEKTERILLHLEGGVRIRRHLVVAKLLDPVVAVALFLHQLPGGAERQRFPAHRPVQVLAEVAEAVKQRLQGGCRENRDPKLESQGVAGFPGNAMVIARQRLAMILAEFADGRSGDQEPAGRPFGIRLDGQAVIAQARSLGGQQQKTLLRPRRMKSDAGGGDIAGGLFQAKRIGGQPRTRGDRHRHVRTELRRITPERRILGVQNRKVIPPVHRRRQQEIILRRPFGKIKRHPDPGGFGRPGHHREHHLQVNRIGTAGPGIHMDLAAPAGTIGRNRDGRIHRRLGNQPVAGILPHHRNQRRLDRLQPRIFHLDCFPSAMAGTCCHCLCQKPHCE